ncbi:MAG TPA: hypothetical protein VEC38_03840 [Candidatus Binataceae bacterium]|nr:hypothetical protein [Candidatus Binataceae bacterium]
MPVALACGALAMPVALGGCWLPALELAPAGLQALSMLGNGAARLFGGGSTTDPRAEEQEAEEQAAAEEEAEKQEIPKADKTCADLQLQAPPIIEFNSATSGSIQYREVGLGGTAGARQWVAVRDNNANADGWIAATNLSKMDFRPPIEGALSAGGSTYLAYAPAEAHDEVERNQLLIFAVDFGPSVGTFRWNDRVYSYTTMRKLPCFASPD